MRIGRIFSIIISSLWWLFCDEKMEKRFSFDAANIFRIINFLSPEQTLFRNADWKAQEIKTVSFRGVTRLTDESFLFVLRKLLEVYIAEAFNYASQLASFL